MKYLVLSDVHGNRFGLDAVMDDAADEWEQVLCLGDVVGYGGHPNACCETLRALNAICLLGNHDAAALGLIDIEWFNPVAKEAILWTRYSLSDENKTWLSSLRPQAVFEEMGFQAVHGSLRQPLEEYITGQWTAQPTFDLMQTPLCFFGHTHIAECYRSLDMTGRKYELQHVALLRGGVVQIEDDWEYLLNPGSCGQPRDGNPQARYAIFDSEERMIEVRAIDYDWEAARDAIIAAELPPLLGERLGRGR